MKKRGIKYHTSRMGIQLLFSAFPQSMEQCRHDTRQQTIPQWPRKEESWWLSSLKMLSFTGKSTQEIPCRELHEQGLEAWLLTLLLKMQHWRPGIRNACIFAIQRRFQTSSFCYHSTTLLLCWQRCHHRKGYSFLDDWFLPFITVT